MKDRTDAHFDHERDLRKHESWPTDRKDPVPFRLQRPITTAEDIALCVRGMKNIVDAAALIQKYADMVAAGARVDQHEESTKVFLRAIDPRPAGQEPSND